MQLDPRRDHRPSFVELPKRRVFLTSGLAVGLAVSFLVLSTPFGFEASMERAFSPAGAPEYIARGLQVLGAFFFGLAWGRR